MSRDRQREWGAEIVRTVLAIIFEKQVQFCISSATSSSDKEGTILTVCPRLLIFMFEAYLAVELRWSVPRLLCWSRRLHSYSKIELLCWRLCPGLCQSETRCRSMLLRTQTNINLRKTTYAEAVHANNDNDPRREWMEERGGLHIQTAHRL